MILRANEERMVVVSDLHLGNPASHAASTFRSFLEYVRVEGFALCLNGDVVEMLQTRFSHLIREVLPLMTQISRLRREGRRVYYVVGNHDIYVEHFLDEWLGTAVCPFLNITSGGKRIRVEHGHLYDPFFAKSPAVYESLTRLGGYFLFMRPMFQPLPRSTARNQDARGGSGGDVVAALNHHRAAEALLRRGFDVVIHGHTHLKESVELGDGLYINSGTWMNGTYVEIDSGLVQLKQWTGR
jgi:UDP-2,3-diacylglucosamine pyrophosphatase LpxH